MTLCCEAEESQQWGEVGRGGCWPWILSDTNTHENISQAMINSHYCSYKGNLIVKSIIWGVSNLFTCGAPPVRLEDIMDLCLVFHTEERGLF